MTLMDALSAPRGMPADALSGRAGTAGRGEAEGEGGFSKVMSSTGRQNEQSGDKAEQQTAESDTLSAGEAESEIKTAADPGKTAKPIIDISTAFIGEVAGKLSAPKENRQLEGVKPAHEKTGKTEGKQAGQKARVGDSQEGAQDALEQAVDELGEMAGLDDAGTIADSKPGDHAAKSSGADDALQLLAASVADGAAETRHVDLSDGKKTPADAGSEKLAASSLLAAQVADNAAGPDDRSGERQSSGDQTFRFVRTDGKGQPLVLQSAERSTAGQDEPARVETVTVMDARRFIAPASTTNAASVTAAMLGDADWVSAMQPGAELANAATQSSQGRVVHTLKIQMTPIELGNVTATLKMVGDELSVHLTVENHAALRQLQADQSDMLSALKAQGLTVDQVQVSLQVAPGDKSASSGQDGAAGQQLGQQAQQSANQGANQERRSAPTSQAGTSDDRGAQELPVQASDTARSRPDQLYL